MRLGGVSLCLFVVVVEAREPRGQVREGDIPNIDPKPITKMEEMRRPMRPSYSLLVPHCGISSSPDMVGGEVRWWLKVIRG